jgi:hypothetical protein
MEPKATFVAMPAEAITFYRSMIYWARTIADLTLHSTSSDSTHCCQKDKETTLRPKG